MLSATVEAAADLNVKVLHCLVGCETSLADPLAQLRRQSARGRNPQLAGIGARATGDINQRACTRISKAHRVKCFVELRQITFAHPADHKVLFDGRANCFPRETPHDVCHRSQLIRSDVAQRQRHNHSDVPNLPLRTGVRPQPFLQLCARAICRVDQHQLRHIHRWLQWRFRKFRLRFLN